MAESNIQLPPNSSGVQVRVELGDATNLIPANVVQEVVTLADAVGILPGDGRQRATLVTDDTLHQILTELQQISFLLLNLVTAAAGSDIDLSTFQDTTF